MAIFLLGFFFFFLFFSWGFVWFWACSNWVMYSNIMHLRRCIEMINESLANTRLVVYLSLYT